MKFYIASRLANVKKHDELTKFLQKHGHELSFNWTEQDNVLVTPRKFEKDELGIHATNDANGVFNAEIVIVLLPGGLGTHAELGMAIGRNKKIIVVGKQKMYGYQCLFYNYPGVVRLDYGKDLFNNILKCFEQLDDKPTRTDGDGTKYWENSKGGLHRDDDLPAVIHANGDSYWFQDDVLHRDNNLPAIVFSSGHCEWWINGDFIKEKDGTLEEVIQYKRPYQK